MEICYLGTYLLLALLPVRAAETEILGTRLCFKNGPNPASFLFIFVPFHNTRTKIVQIFTINELSIDEVLGSRTRGSMMEGADESTELWRHQTYSQMVEGLSVD